MKNRSDLFYIFQTFYNEIKTQIVVSVRILWSDNDREYLSVERGSYFNSYEDGFDDVQGYTLCALPA